MEITFSKNKIRNKFTKHCVKEFAERNNNKRKSLGKQEQSRSLFPEIFILYAFCYLFIHPILHKNGCSWKCCGQYRLLPKSDLPDH